MPKLAGETRSAMYPLPYRQNCLFAAETRWPLIHLPAAHWAISSEGVPVLITRTSKENCYAWDRLGNAFKCCSFKPAGKVRNHGKGRHWTNTEDLSVDPWILKFFMAGWVSSHIRNSKTLSSGACNKISSSYEVSINGVVMMQNKSSDKVIDVIVIDQNIACD